MRSFLVLDYRQSPFLAFQLNGHGGGTTIIVYQVHISGTPIFDVFRLNGVFLHYNFSTIIIKQFD